MPGHVRQLARALDLRVAREDLLKQCRTRARHPDDEDRIGGRVTPAGARREKLGVEERALSPLRRGRY